MMPQISTRNLKLLPDVDRLKALLQSLATLDAILSPDWEDRYYSFDSCWADNEQMGSMRNHSGDEFFALFNASGCFLKGFAHESPMTPYRTDPPRVWSGLLENIPEEFASGVNEPAFSMDDVTFCIWRQYDDPSWQHGPVDFPDAEDPDGSAYLLEILDAKPETYCDFAEDYYETTVPLEFVIHIYEHALLTDAVVSSINSEVTLKSVAEELVGIGYPS